MRKVVVSKSFPARTNTVLDALNAPVPYTDELGPRMISIRSIRSTSTGNSVATYARRRCCHSRGDHPYFWICSPVTMVTDAGASATFWRNLEAP